MDRNGQEGLTPRRDTHYAVYAVSYTHLRAHETVLDIVCRLLLEKKQKKKQQTTVDFTDSAKTGEH